MSIISAVTSVVKAIENDKSLYRATRILSPDTIVRATRRNKSTRQFGFEVILSVTRPNYEERQFIKLLKKSNEPFPLKRLRFKYFED